MKALFIPEVPASGVFFIRMYNPEVISAAGTECVSSFQDELIHKKLCLKRRQVKFLRSLLN